METSFLTSAYALLAYGLIALWLLWRTIRPKPLHEDYWEHLAESYNLIQAAYLAICEQNFVADADWAKISQADWIAKHFLSKKLRRFTRNWVKKATDANLLHKNMGKYGHLDPIGSAELKAKTIRIAFTVENKNDEAVILQWLKAHKPKDAYKEYLPSLLDE